jgi:chromosomal replication initiator protein
VTTIASIKTAVARHYGVPRSALADRYGKRLEVHPRCVGMFLARTLTNRSLQQIGNQFGHRHHTTVLAAVRSVAALRAARPVVASEIDLIADDVA